MHTVLFKYNMLPFSVSSALAILQRTIESLVQHVVAYIDGILIAGEAEQDHLNNLAEVRKRQRNAWMQLNMQVSILVGKGRIPGTLYYEGWNFHNNGQDQHQKMNS